MNENADVVIFAHPDTALSLAKAASKEEKSTIIPSLIVGEAFPKGRVFVVETRRFEKFLRSYGKEYAKETKEGGEENG